MSKRVSVVMATYNRGALLRDLLNDLAQQDLPAADFEVIVVDDGSKEPVAPHVEGMQLPYELKLVRQTNAGPAAARHRGVEMAQGDIVVITDDDMRVESNFLREHVKAHDAGATVVLGHIVAASNLTHMPVFERFHAYQLDRFVEGVRDHSIQVHGIHVCTGNLSFRRADYLAIGGFDKSLNRSEDRELGVRLEKTGAKLVFAEAAKTVHESDHSDLNVWLKRAYNYGVYDRRIAQKHPDVELADPWRFFFLISPLSRPLMLVPLTLPVAGEKFSRLVIQTAIASDKLGLKKLAVLGTTLTYGLEYFRGMRSDAGSFGQAVRDMRGYVRKHRSEKDNSESSTMSKKKVSTRQALKNFVDGVRGDYGVLQRYRAKYHNDTLPLHRMPLDFVQKIGFQMAGAVRVMHLTRDLGIPLAPQVVSRLIRHLYSSEIHWDAQIEPGLAVVHGVGLIISHAASVGGGCILFQNVTLGEGTDPVTRAVGAPRLGRDVHVGPGATLIGPIEIGDGTKIMAGAVLTQSVPANSLVRPADAVITERGKGKPARPGAA